MALYTHILVCNRFTVPTVCFSLSAGRHNTLRIPNVLFVGFLIFHHFQFYINFKYTVEMGRLEINAAASRDADVTKK